MFTGIIQGIGRLAEREARGGDVRFTFATGTLPWLDSGIDDVLAGESIAVNGVCLTVVAFDAGSFQADASTETLALTTLGALPVGAALNLERAMRPSDRLGGHMVSGHVDGVGEVVSRSENARAVEFRIRAPKELAKYIAHKGSITVDGTSLTVNAVNGAEFALTIIPHTLSETIMASYQPGRRVNLEVDLLARYLERLLLGEKAAEPAAGNITESFLAANGYLKS